MKTAIFKFLFTLLLITNFDTTNLSDQILGKWQNPDKDRQIEIFKEGNFYFGKILWLKDTKNVKVKNGEIVMKNIEFSNDNKWIGKIKVPARDNDFDMEITMPDKNKLKFKVSYGLISRTKIWTRIK